MEVDTGAAASVMCKLDYDKYIKHVSLKTGNGHFQAYGGEIFHFWVGLGKCRHFLDFAMPVAKSGIFRENLANSDIIWQNLESTFLS